MKRRRSDGWERLFRQAFWSVRLRPTTCTELRKLGVKVSEPAVRYWHKCEYIVVSSVTLWFANQPKGIVVSYAEYEQYVEAAKNGGILATDAGEKRLSLYSDVSFAFKFTGKADRMLRLRDAKTVEQFKMPGPWNDSNNPLLVG